MAVPAVFRKYNEISLIKRILVGLAVGIVLALLIPNAQPSTDIITLLGSLFVGALKAVAPVLVFFLVISALCNAHGAGTMKTVVVLYVISTLVAAIVALIGSEIFPTSLTLDTSSMVEQAAPEGIGEVLTTLLMNIVANPVDALMNANYVGILALGRGARHRLARRSASAPRKCSPLHLRRRLQGRALGHQPGAVRHHGPGRQRLGEHHRAWTSSPSTATSFWCSSACMLIIALRHQSAASCGIVHAPATRSLLVLRCLKDSGLTAFFTRSSAANIPVNMELCRQARP